MTALSTADPGRPIDWEMDSRVQAARRAPAVCSLGALVGVENDAGHLPAAYRDRQVRIVMPAQGEPQYPAGGHVQHAIQVQRALTGGYLGAVAVPFLVDLRRREVPLDQIRRPPLAPARTGARPALLLRPGGQAHLGHYGGDGVLADLPPSVPNLGLSPGNGPSLIV
jgi:hypothetical protein